MKLKIHLLKTFSNRFLCHDLFETPDGKAFIRLSHGFQAFNSMDEVAIPDNQIFSCVFTGNYVEMDDGDVSEIFSPIDKKSGEKSG